MKKIFINLLCVFIYSKELRRKIRTALLAKKATVIVKGLNNKIIVVSEATAMGGRAS
jgi:hypothetical protein